MGTLFKRSNYAIEVSHSKTSKTDKGMPYPPFRRVQYRKKTLYWRLRRGIGGIFRGRCLQVGVDLLEEYAMKYHIRMLLMIWPKYSR